MTSKSNLEYSKSKYLLHKRSPNLKSSCAFFKAASLTFNKLAGVHLVVSQPLSVNKDSISALWAIVPASNSPVEPILAGLFWRGPNNDPHLESVLCLAHWEGQSYYWS